MPFARDVWITHFWRMANDTDDREMVRSIGQRLYATRTALDLTQTAFAARIGVPQPSYNHWETGKRMLPPKWAIKICHTFRVTTDWLYLGDASGLPYRLHDAIAKVADSDDSDT
jgi:DNA-binding XRE family transcriptional regulator